MKHKALISISNKIGIINFLQQIKEDFSFLSTGRTFLYLKDKGIDCSSIAEYTGFQEILGGRVKSLHPKIYAGILSLRKDQEKKILLAQGIEYIDLVVVNFYPFIEKLQEKLPFWEMLEFIDIGGPAMLRAAAKNYPFVVPICDPQDYCQISKAWNQEKKISLEFRKKLAIKAFSHCIELDKQIVNYLTGTNKKVALRYGENPHQKAFIIKNEANAGLAALQKIQGKELSYNNYLDIQSALDVIADLPVSKPATVIIKHNNPCGVASGATASQSLEMAWESDVISAFGGIIATNFVVDLNFAKFLVSSDIEHFSYQWSPGSYKKVKISKKFFEILIAPNFEKNALNLLQQNSKTAILLKYPVRENNIFLHQQQSLDGVFLEQEKNIQKSNLQSVTKKIFSKDMAKLANFGIICCKYAKSNAVVLVREYAPRYYQLLGMGCGQPNRIDALLKLAIPKMEENLKREYMKNKIYEEFDLWSQKQKQKLLLVSDAFFPFNDIVQAAHHHNIDYILHPGGSKNDKASIDFCNQHGMTMAFSGFRHFRH